MASRALRSLWTAMMAALLAAPAAAAPLCRDAKGLFTPCPRTANERARAILASAAARAEAAEAEVASEPRPPATRRPAPIRHHAKLCTDSKGLFTPCAR